jgi:hypothetical protein
MITITRLEGALPTSAATASCAASMREATSRVHEPASAVKKKRN